LLLLLLTHLVIFSPFRKGVKLLFIWGTFGAAVASEAGGWLVRFVSPALAPVKVAGFVVLESLLGILLFAVAWSLWSGSSVHRQNGRAITKDILVPGESEEGDEVVSVGGNLRGRSGRS
jgi:hypothetical protein